MSPLRHKAARLMLASATVALGATAATANGAAPEIRLSALNRVPSCAAPERLMAFLKSRNDRLDPRYADIARFYREQGDAWRVRWDYAFFQMIVETNALSFRRGNGDPGDVKPRQNNFAGIGTTGGGVPGDSFPDVRTGVAAHVQHLVAYSGERLAEPVAPRTQLKQDDIVEVSRRLKRPVNFADLARRWAVDRRYWQSIEAIASSFRTNHCTTAADLAPLPEAKALSLVARKAKGPAQAQPTTGAASEPAMVREPAMAKRPADRHSARSTGPVRTVWRDGERPAPLQNETQGSPSGDAAQAAQMAVTPRETVAAAVPAPTSMPAQPIGTSADTEPTTVAAASPPQPGETTPRKFAFASGLAMHGHRSEYKTGHRRRGHDSRFVRHRRL